MRGTVSLHKYSRTYAALKSTSSQKHEVELNGMNIWRRRSSYSVFRKGGVTGDPKVSTKVLTMAEPLEDEHLIVPYRWR